MKNRERLHAFASSTACFERLALVYLYELCYPLTTLSHPSAPRTLLCPGSVTRPQPPQHSSQSPLSSSSPLPSPSSTSPRSSTPCFPHRLCPALQRAVPGPPASTACSRSDSRSLVARSHRRASAARTCLRPAASWAGTSCLRRRGPCARSLVMR